jgi:tetratricopeptide (TPR) repeat protein
MHPLTRLLTAAALACAALAAAAQDDLLAKQLLVVEHQWARINYQMPANARDKAYATLQTRAAALAAHYPRRPEPKVWEAIVLSSRAGAHGGLGALSMVRQARDLLRQAEKIDPATLHGSIYTSLGSLYYQVPGWPLSFGDDDKAAVYLKKALALNPNGIDPNYFYGDYLYRQGRYREALTALRKALRAPARPGRTLADQGRRHDVEALIAKIRARS